MDQGNVVLGKKLNKIAIALSVFILILVILMRRIKLDVDFDFAFLAGTNALFNSFTSIFLIGALYMVKMKRIVGHKRFMTAALVSSILFFLCYIMYHFTTPETSFCKEGWIRIFYYFILITHVVLAGISLPFILFTYIKAYTNQIEKHKKLARKVYPVWLYVSITGPVVYLLLKPCYGI